MAPLIAGPHNKPSVAVLCIAAFAAVRREACTREGMVEFKAGPYGIAARAIRKTNVYNVGKVSIPRIERSRATPIVHHARDPVRSSREVSSRRTDDRDTHR